MHYFNQVRASNPTPKVHPYFERLIKPLFERTDDDDDDVDGKMGFSEEFEELKREREQVAAKNGGGRKK